MLGWREHYCNFDSGDKQKCHGYIFEKHMAYVNFTSHFSSLCSTAASKLYKFLKTKHTAHIYSRRKDKGCKNFYEQNTSSKTSHMVESFNCQDPDSICLLLFKTANNRTQRNRCEKGCEVLILFHAVAKRGRADEI